MFAGSVRLKSAGHKKQTTKNAGGIQKKNMATLALLGGEAEVEETVNISWPMYDATEREALVEVLESRSWYNAAKCREFEETFAAFQDAKYGIACTGGTVALEMICRGAGIGIYRVFSWYKWPPCLSAHAPPKPSKCNEKKR